jgi:hypothetical protein
MRPIAFLLAAVALTFPVAHARPVFAQAAQAAATAGDGKTTTTTVSTGSTTSSSVQVYPGGVAPLRSGQVLGGGNVRESSSRPKIGNETDGFDLTPRTGGDVSVRGSGNGPIFGGSPSVTLGDEQVTGPHVVKKGDTLWAICEHYFQNAYQWPRIWSYNPQIQNPHWIEIGDQVQLQPSGAGGATGGSGGGPADPMATRPSQSSGRLVDARRRVPQSTVFLREEGFVQNEAVDTWGEITGAPEDKMFLMDTDDVYVRVAPEKDVRVGQELTVFRPVRSAGDGKIVQIQGTVRVSSYNARDRVARGRVIETLDVIERGARLGNIPRRFEIVPPVRDEADLDAKVLGSVVSHQLYGQYQVVYLDKGADDGLRPGNLLLAMRQGDQWRQSLPSTSAAKRIALESDSPAQVESIPPPRDEKNYPEEIVGEIRILTTRNKTSMAVVTQSSREIETTDVLRARKGY